jgi:type IV secretory pathway component VirB8
MNDLRKAVNDALDNHQERIDALYNKQRAQFQMVRERDRRRIDLIAFVVYSLLLAVVVAAMAIVVLMR